MSNRIMRDPFHTAFKHFSELHGMLIESLNYSYNQKNNVACPMSLLPHLPLIMELGFFCDLTDSSDNIALGPLLGSNLKTCSIFPEPCLCSDSPVLTPVSFLVFYKEGTLLYWYSRQRNKKHVLG